MLVLTSDCFSVLLLAFACFSFLLLAFDCFCLRLLAFRCFCLLVLAFACCCLLFLAVACCCLLLLAFACFCWLLRFCITVLFVVCCVCLQSFDFACFALLFLALACFLWLSLGCDCFSSPLLTFVCSRLLVLAFAIACSMLLAVACFCLLCIPLLWYPGHATGIRLENDTRAAAGHPKKRTAEMLSPMTAKKHFFARSVLKCPLKPRSSPCSSPLGGGSCFQQMLIVYLLAFLAPPADEALLDEPDPKSWVSAAAGSAPTTTFSSKAAPLCLLFLAFCVFCRFCLLLCAFASPC